MAGAGLPSGGGSAANAVVTDADNTLGDGVDIAVGSTTGTKFPTAASEKWGRWGADPVVQQSNVPNATTSFDVTGAQTVSQVGVQNALAGLGTKINSIFTILKNTGDMASS